MLPLAIGEGLAATVAIFSRLSHICIIAGDLKCILEGKNSISHNSNKESADNIKNKIAKFRKQFRQDFQILRYESVKNVLGVEVKGPNKPNKYPCLLCSSVNLLSTETQA